MFLLSLNGCGYKADPFYSEDTSTSNSDVEFKLNKSNNNGCAKE